MCAVYLFYREESAREMLGIEDQMSRCYRHQVFRALRDPPLAVWIAERVLREAGEVIIIGTGSFEVDVFARTLQYTFRPKGIVHQE